MNEQEEKTRAAQRALLLKRILIPLMLLSLIGTYLASGYSFFLADAPVPFQAYSDPVLSIFLVWSFFGLLLVLFAYYSRLQILLTRKQMILLGIIFIVYPIFSYVYIGYLYLVNRPRETVEGKSSEDTNPTSITAERI